MRIALITETFLPNVNGVVTTVCRLLEHLRTRGHEALLFAPEGAPESYAGARIVPLRGTPLPLYPELRFTPPQPGILEQLKAFQPDILHLAGAVALGPVGRYAAWQLGIPLVATYHTDWPRYSAHYGLGMLRRPIYSFLRWIHNGCAMTFCPSTATLDDLRANGFRRLRLWGRGVDTERFRPECRSDAWRASIGVQAHETVLLYVGRLASEKRLDVLADALEGQQNVRMVFVGDGPARAQLEQRLKGHNAVFTGYLRGDALATAYASADLFAFPSDTETFGQVVQEAMASGLPVIAARAGGAVDLVREQETGLLFTPGNTAELRSHIRRLAADAPLRTTMGQAALAIAQRRTWDRVLDELIGHYRYARRHSARLGVTFMGMARPPLRREEI